MSKRLISLVWLLTLLSASSVLAERLTFDFPLGRLVAVERLREAHGELTIPLGQKLVSVELGQHVKRESHEFIDTGNEEPANPLSIHVPLSSPPQNASAMLRRTDDDTNFRFVLLEWENEDSFVFHVAVGQNSAYPPKDQWHRTHDPYRLRLDHGFFEEFSDTRWMEENKWVSKQKIAHNTTHRLITLPGASEQYYNDLLHSITYKRLLIAAAKEEENQFVQNLVAYISASNLNALSDQKNMPVYTIEAQGLFDRAMYYPRFFAPSDSKDEQQIDDLGRSRWYDSQNSPNYSCKLTDAEERYYVSMLVSPGPLFDHSNEWTDGAAARAALMEACFVAEGILAQFHAGDSLLNSEPSP